MTPTSSRGLCSLWFLFWGVFVLALALFVCVVKTHVASIFILQSNLSFEECALFLIIFYGGSHTRFTRILACVACPIMFIVYSFFMFSLTNFFHFPCGIAHTKWRTTYTTCGPNRDTRCSHAGGRMDKSKNNAHVIRTSNAQMQCALNAFNRVGPPQLSASAATGRVVTSHHAAYLSRCPFFCPIRPDK